jgi:cell division protein FtsZ
MREGPLADLFRSTTDPEDIADPPAPPAGLGRSDTPAQASEPEATDEPAPVPAESRDVFEFDDDEPAHDAPDPVTPVAAEPEREPEDAASMLTELPPPAMPPKDRLSRIFGEDPDPGPPVFGRAEPDFGAVSGPPDPSAPQIRVVGVGGAGVNAINRMVEAGIPGVEFLAINTDLQSLQQSSADVTVHLGTGHTRGLGAGSNPELGYRAAFEEQDKVKRLLKGSDMVFVTAGAGGGTGTGAAPVVARLARDVGALTVGIVTKPFAFEGSRRAKQADDGIAKLAAEVDTLIVVPNERLLTVLAKNTKMTDAFQVADDVLRQGVQGISDLITLPGMINLDFADVRTTMRDAGQALLGIGMGTGEGGAIAAAQRAVSSPLLETSVEGARSILLSITGGQELTLLEVSEAAKIVQEAAHPDANIIFGANVDDTLGGQVWVTVIATRFEDGVRAQPRRGSSERLRNPDEEERPPSRPARQPRASRDVDLDIPEFVPGN